MLASSDVDPVEGGAPRAARSGPKRSCVGCGEVGKRADLMRVVLAEDGTLHVDLRGRELGRGAWLHAATPCLERAAKVGLSRSFRAPVGVTPTALLEALHRATHARVEALLRTGVRAGKLVVGKIAVDEALKHDRAHAVLVATDARAAGSSREVALFVTEGRAMAWGTKDQLGMIVGRTEAGVIAVVDRELALGLLRCSAVLQMPEPMDHKKTAKRMNKVDE